MLLFLFLLLPLSLAFFLVTFREYKFQPALIIGIFTAILLCIVKALFVFPHRVVPNSFSENYFFFLLNENLLPQLVIYGLYFILAKDNSDLKLKSYFPMLCSFYALYLPYMVISMNESEVYSGFSIFIKPLIYLAMLFMCARTLNYFSAASEKKPWKTITSVFFIIVYIFVPALIEVLYVMNISTILFILCTVIYILVPFVLLFFSVIKNNSAKKINA